MTFCQNFSVTEKMCLLSCKTCGKQYTGKTVDKFKSRWNYYKTDGRKAASGNIESCKEQFLQSYFLQDDHHAFLKDVEVTLIDESQASDHTKREYYWMKTLKTLYPDGLNLESDYQFLSFLVSCTCLSHIWELARIKRLSPAFQITYPQ